MSLIQVRFIKLQHDAMPFAYARTGDACMDMYALEDTVILGHQVQLVKTGIAIELPLGTEGIVRGRSGLARKGIFCHVGTIDRTYRGDVGVILYNTTEDEFHITKGMRIAQFTVQPTQEITLVDVDELSETERGSNGFGSTGLF